MIDVAALVVLAALLAALAWPAHATTYAFAHEGTTARERFASLTSTQRTATIALWLGALVQLLALAHAAFIDVAVTSWRNAAPATALVLGGAGLFAACVRALRRGARVLPSFLRGAVPDVLVVDGPWRFVRHPLYASYVLVFAAAPIALASRATLVHAAVCAGVWVGVTTFYAWAARGEERALLASAHGDAYRAYRETTGAFIPRMPRTRRGA